MAKGASASHRDSAGASVLVHAAHARMPKVVKALLAGTSGVDKDAASDEGVTALIAAAMKVLHAVGRGTLHGLGRSGAYVLVLHARVGQQCTVTPIFGCCGYTMPKGWYSGYHIRVPKWS